MIDQPRQASLPHSPSPFWPRLVCLISALALFVSACAPGDVPGGKLQDLAVTLEGKNPSADGAYLLRVGENAPLVVEGHYDNGRTYDISLAVFFKTDPADLATLACERSDLVSPRVILSGVAAGSLALQAFTREQPDTSIPCATTPDGGWTFPDAGPDYPKQSDPIAVEVIAE